MVEIWFYVFPLKKNEIFFGKNENKKRKIKKRDFLDEDKKKRGRDLKMRLEKEI